MDDDLQMYGDYELPESVVGTLWHTKCNPLFSERCLNVSKNVLGLDTFCFHQYVVHWQFGS